MSLCDVTVRTGWLAGWLAGGMARHRPDTDMHDKLDRSIQFECHSTTTQKVPETP